MDRLDAIRLRHVLTVEAFRRRPSEIKQLRYDSPLPRYASGLRDVEVVAGGFYGLAVVGGPPKSGKSLLAMRAALDTTEREGWSVIYVDLELDAHTLAGRLLAATGARSGAELADMLAGRMRIIDGADDGAHELADRVAQQIDELHERVLVVIDSINRLAKNQQLHRPKSSYFQELGSIVSWARRCVTLTRGRISCLLVSEVNRAGAITGQDPEYAADCFVTLSRTDGASPSEVEVEFTSRSTAGFSLRTYRRDGYAARFARADEAGPRPLPAQTERSTTQDDDFSAPIEGDLFS